MIILSIVKKLNRVFDSIRNRGKTIYLKFILSERLKIGRRIYFGSHFNLDITARKCIFNIGNSVVFRKHAVIRIREGAELHIGNNVFFNESISINCRNKIVIGDHCMFGENVKLYDHNHRFRDKSTPIIDQGFSVGFIEIGKNCWIGSNVVILKNVKIGNSVVVGSNCLITDDIPENSIVRLKAGATVIEPY